MTADLSDYDSETMTQIPATNLAIFVLSTFGEGDPSDNAAAFWDWIHLTDASLSNLHYVAFGLGNKNYKYYNRVVDVVSASLNKHGAKPLMPIGKADDAAGGTEEDFITWRDDLFTFFRQELHFEEGTMEYEPTLFVEEEHSLASTDLYLGKPSGQRSFSETASGNSAIEHIPVKSSRELFTSSSRNCVHMEFDLTHHPEMRYKTGDHIAIWPINPEDEVEIILQLLGISDRRNVPISIRPMEQSLKVKIPSPTTIEALFKYYLEVCAPVSRDTLLNLVQFAPNESARRFLRTLSSDKCTFTDYLSRTHLTLGRLLQIAVDSDPAATWSSLPLSLVIESLPSMQPRYYSISSSSATTPRYPSISALVSKTSPTNAPELFIHGVTSNYLVALQNPQQASPSGAAHLDSFPIYDIHGTHGRSESEVRLYAQIRRSKFKLPTRTTTPLVMIGAGTGVAPFRAFVAERARFASIGRPVGEMLLFFGCRRPDEDFIYSEEFEGARAGLEGKSTFSIVTAFSRVDGVYVQDMVREQAKSVVRLLEDGANLYICGRARMAREVGKVVCEAMGSSMGWSKEEVGEWSGGLKRRGIWQEDVWG